MSFAPHSHLGPYEILSSIGEGGMGEVYKARDTRLGRDVAIKIVLPSFAADPERLRRFEQEARLIAQLNHPNLLQVFDVGLHADMPYLVMELLEGETLRQRMDQRPLSLKRTLDIAVQIARGLAAAHEKGIVHRDLKPENIFILENEQVKILDFGLAKLKAETFAEPDKTSDSPTVPVATRVGTVVGTVGYMSPEQVRGISVDARSDIFSFGIILWEMLTGKRPFRGESVVETLHAILKDDPPDFPMEAHPHPTLERILQRCLAKDPKIRFQSAQDMAFHLESASTVSASTVLESPIVRQNRRTRDKHFKPFLLGGSIVLLLLGAWISHFFTQSPTLDLRRLTYSNGVIRSARFAPGGQTFVFSVNQDGRPGELYFGRTNAMGGRPLGFPPGTTIQSISINEEMAILLPDENHVPCTLARAPMSGGAPREVAENVKWADWSPDGKDLALVRFMSDGKERLEYPVGKVLYEAPMIAGPIRVSPKGDLVAYVDARGVGNVELCVVDLQGKRRSLVKGEVGTFQWDNSGGSLYYIYRYADDRVELRSIDLSGRSRSIYPVLGRMHLHDITGDGRLLVDHTLSKHGMRCLAPGEATEKEISWLQSSNVADLSADGKLLLFGELREGAGPGGAYLRKTDGSDAIRLCDGDPLQISQDGKWTLVRTFDRPPALALVPTGVGETRHIPAHGVAPNAAWFFPDNTRILVGGYAGDRGYGYFIQNISSGDIRPLTPAGVEDAYYAVSPDGSEVALGPMEGKLRIYPAKGGEPRILEGLEAHDHILQWSADGKNLFLGDLRGIPARIYTFELATGKRKLWKELSPPDGFGVSAIDNLTITPDGKAYAYSFDRTLTSDLYLMQVQK